jgi:hypothetical protein
MISLIKHHRQVNANSKQRTCLSLTMALSYSDEYALVAAVKDMGVVFFRRTPDSVVIDFVSQMLCIMSIIDIFYISAWRRRTIRNSKCIGIQQVSIDEYLLNC